MKRKIGEIIKQYRNENNLSLRDFASRTSLSHSYISKLENNPNSELTIPSAKEIANAMHISVEELLALLDGTTIFSLQPNVENVNNNLVEIPILGSIPAGTPVEAVEDIQGSQLVPQDALRYPEKEYFCLKISGSSMYPTYIDGDIVLFHSQFEANSGQDVCVYVNGYDATFKRLMMHEDGLELIAINPEYENRFYTKEECQELPVRVIGVAVKLIRNLE